MADVGATATVVRVVDGDTILAVVDGVEERVRFLNVDTPEVGACLAGAASKLTESRLPSGALIELAYDRDLRDFYDRLLAVVRPAGGVWLSVDLAANGLGFPMKIAPNDAFYSEVATASDAARRRGLGLFDPTLACTPVSRTRAASQLVNQARSMPARTRSQYQAVTGVLNRAEGKLELLVPRRYGVLAPSFSSILTTLKRPVRVALRSVRAAKASQWRDAQKPPSGGGSSSSGGDDDGGDGGWWPPGVPRDYTGPRCYQPGGVIWYPC